MAVLMICDHKDSVARSYNNISLLCNKPDTAKPFLALEVQLP